MLVCECVPNGFLDLSDTIPQNPHDDPAGIIAHVT